MLVMSNESNSSGQFGQKNVHVTESVADIARRTGQNDTWAQQAHDAAVRAAAEAERLRKQNNGGF
jgi:hypothetical protein